MRRSNIISGPAGYISLSTPGADGEGMAREEFDAFKKMWRGFGFVVGASEHRGDRTVVVHLRHPRTLTEVGA